MTTYTANQLGHLRVNDTDYDGRIVIERFDYYSFSDTPAWAVPAWDECGADDLSGDTPEFTHHNGQRYLIGHSWSSRAAAERALRLSGLA